VVYNIIVEKINKKNYSYRDIKLWSYHPHPYWQATKWAANV